MEIRAVLFDLGGTLLDEEDPTGWSEIAGTLRLAIEPEHLAHAHREVQAELDRPEPPAASELWREVLSRAVGRPIETVTAERFLSLWRAREYPARLFSDVRYCLETLQGERYALGIVSNSRSEAHVRADLERTGIGRFFPVVVSSGTERIRKPDPAIFHRAVTRLQLSPEEVCFVGDLAYRDARAATAAGLHGIWLHRYGWGFGEDPPEITSLSELPEYVRRLRSRSR